MQTIDWTIEMIVVAAVIGLALAAVGFLLAAVLKGQANGRLAAEVEQAQNQLQQVQNQLQTAQSQQQQLENNLHDKNLSEQALRGQLATAEATEKRLTGERDEYKQKANDVVAQLDEARRLRHVTENELGKTQSENNAHKENLDDLRKRLNKAQEDVQAERDSVSALKSELAAEGRKAKSQETANESIAEQLADAKRKLAAEEDSYKQLQERFQQINSDHTELKTTLEGKEKHFKEQLQQVNDTKQSLTKEFENLANKIFEEKGKTFTHTSQAGIEHLLKPFREQIEGFRTRVNEIHEASVKGNTSLNDEIRKVLDIGLTMSKEANNLTSALKGDSQQRGAWGEAQLCRTLEMSGLVEGDHYESQNSFKDTEGKTKRTDYLIKLPDAKHIVIDSKITLNAYDRAVGAKTPEEYTLAMGEHVQAVRKHIDDLAEKDYTNLIGVHSPGFVLMFMPIEPAYIEALKTKKDLFDYGYNKGIVLVSHTTLIPILRTVSNLWMIERSNAEAREISEKAGDIYNQVRVVAERLNKLGGTLKTASSHYNGTVKALAGQQGLYGKVDRFSQLSAKVSKELPQLEPSHTDFESERLALIAEPIDESQQALVQEGVSEEDDTVTEPLTEFNEETT